MNSIATQPRICLAGALLILLALASAPQLSAAPPCSDSPLTITLQLHNGQPDYRKTFDLFDAGLRHARGYSDCDNTDGKLAWAESYLLMGYIEMWRATSDTLYLRKLTQHFDRILATRDDARAIADAYTSRPLAGWGAPGYNLRDAHRWHVFIVHTGMITLAPAEFVREVSANPTLHREFGSTASLYRQRIDECIRDAQPYWTDGPAPDEGYYRDPVFGLLPLNQSNAMGRVLLEMHAATGNPAYRERATRLARFFRNRMRTTDTQLLDWSYWPKAQDTDTTTSSEDISHAAINVDFAARCAAAGIVFTHDDMQRLAHTWLTRIRRPDGTWASTVSGGHDDRQYIPGAAGRWLGLCPFLKPPLAKQFYDDIARAFRNHPVALCSSALGLARLLRYQSLP